jgi:hypothetical protein
MDTYQLVSANEYSPKERNLQHTYNSMLVKLLAQKFLNLLDAEIKLHQDQAPALQHQYSKHNRILTTNAFTTSYIKK